MNKNVSDSIDSFIADLGDSLAYWTSYLTSVKRGPVLQESAVRYAISEFLEVNKHNDYGSPIIKEFNFEQDHPYFKGKSSDLFFRASFPNTDPSSLIDPPSQKKKKKKVEKDFTIEFKYIRDKARDTNGQEFRRYVIDLCRLHCISKNERNLSQCYFVVVGEYFSFFDNFYSIQKKKRGPKPCNNNQITEEIVRDYKPKGQYADLLPFSLDDRERTVNLEQFVFIKQALDKAIDPDPTNKDTTFLWLDISEINKLRREVFHRKSTVSKVQLIKSDEVFKIRLVYSNIFIDQQENHHPDTQVCIWEVL